MLKLSSSAKQQAGEGEQLRDRVAEAGQTAERPAAERQHDEAGDGDQLERHAVREQRVEGDDGQGRDDHVEAVHRHPGVPVHAPPGELEVGQQVVAQERRPPHVGAHVAAGGRRVVEDQVGARVQRVEVDDVHHHHGRDEQRQAGDDDPHDTLGRPGCLGPAHGTADDAAPGPHRPRRRPWLGRLVVPATRDSVSTSPVDDLVVGRARARRRPPRRIRGRSRRRGRHGSPRSLPSFIATGNDGSPRPDSAFTARRAAHPSR